MTTLSREAVAEAIAERFGHSLQSREPCFTCDRIRTAADAAVALARPENEVKAEALTEFAEEQLYDGDTDRPLSGHEAAYEAAYTFAERLRSRGGS